MPHERTAAPVVGDLAPHARFPLGPGAGPRWPLAPSHLQARGVTALLPRHLPQPRATARAPTASGGQQAVRGLGRPPAAPARPPRPPVGPRPCCRLRLDADADPAPVVGPLVDPVGPCCPPTRVHAILHPPLLGRAWGLSLTPAMGTGADPCVWRGSERDDRLTARVTVLDAGLDGCTWRATVRRRRPRVRWAGAWSAVVAGLAPRADGAGAHLRARPAPRLRPPARTRTGPTPWGQRVAARRRRHEGLQGLQPWRVRRRQGLAACTWGAKTSAHHDGCGGPRPCVGAQPHRAGGESRRPRASGHATVAKTAGLGRRPQPSRPFVSGGLERLILGGDRVGLGACHQEGEDHPMTQRWQPIRCVIYVR
jgi:hypothetical protein